MLRSRQCPKTICKPARGRFSKQRTRLGSCSTITLVQVVSRRPRSDWGDLDVVVGVREHLTFERDLPAALAALGKEVAGHIGVRTELAGHARTALAALLLPARLVRDIGLLPTRGRQRGVRRCLRRFAGATLELCDTRQERADLLEELVDRRLQRIVLVGELVDPPP